MNTEDLETLTDQQFNDCRRTLTEKNAEYARDGDKLSNFKKAAGAQGITPEEALIGMYMKHVISLVDFARDLGRGIPQPTEKWEEKIRDAINYPILLRGLLVDRGHIPPTGGGHK